MTGGLHDPYCRITAFSAWLAVSRPSQLHLVPLLTETLDEVL